MYNLHKPRDRARYLRATTRRRDSNFNASERIIRAVFAKERRAMLAAVPKVGRVDTAAWEQAFKRIWILSGENSWKYNEETWGRVQRNVKEPKPKALTAMWLHYKQVPAWMGYVDDYLDQWGAEKIKDIGNVTKQRVKAALAEGIANDESIPDLAARIEELYGGFDTNRAVMIARSETIESFNRGSQAQAKEVGSTLDNMWVCTDDDRTRDEHKPPPDGIGNTTVPYDQEFECDDGTTWPGDAVNCRCCIGYCIPEGNGQ